MRAVAVVRTFASLSIHHAELSARHVTDRLGIEPTTSFEHGDPYVRGTKLRTQSGWDLASDLPDDGGDLERHLRTLVDRLLPLRDIVEDLAVEGYRMKWSCFISEENGQGGFDLSHALVRDLALLPVDVWFDLYVEDGPET
jgi:Domain of unknown function (DUF4279)